MTLSLINKLYEIEEDYCHCEDFEKGHICEIHKRIHEIILLIPEMSDE